MFVSFSVYFFQIESCYDAYNFYKVAKHSLKFVNDLSNTYFSIVKDRFVDFILLSFERVVETTAWPH